MYIQEMEEEKQHHRTVKSTEIKERFHHNKLELWK